VVRVCNLFWTGSGLRGVAAKASIGESVATAMAISLVASDTFPSAGRRRRRTVTVTATATVTATVTVTATACCCGG